MLEIDKVVVGIGTGGDGREIDFGSTGGAPPKAATATTDGYSATTLLEGGSTEPPGARSPLQAPTERAENPNASDTSGRASPVHPLEKQFDAFPPFVSSN
jgi:hypothetical protein